MQLFASTMCETFVSDTSKPLGTAGLLGLLSATIVEFKKVDPTAAYLMLPYLGWTTFATVRALRYWACLDRFF